MSVQYSHVIYLFALDVRPCCRSQWNSSFHNGIDCGYRPTCAGSASFAAQWHDVLPEGHQRSVGTDAGFLLRPEWVSQVAREVDTFRRSLPPAGREAARLDRFFSSLPPPACELERRILNDLRERLTRSQEPATPTPAERARQLLLDEYQKPWTLEDLARTVACNRTTLQQSFQVLTGTTVHRYLVRRRVSAAERLLAAADIKVSRVSHDVGYRSHSAFTRHFKQITGTTPTMYHESRRSGRAALHDDAPVE
jgi:AraC-like DNA-binding protein